MAPTLSTLLTLLPLLLLSGTTPAQAQNPGPIVAGTEPFSGSVMTTVLGSTVLTRSDAGSTADVVVTSSGLPYTSVSTVPTHTTALVLSSEGTTVTAPQSRNVANQDGGEPWLAGMVAAAAMAVGAI